MRPAIVPTPRALMLLAALAPLAVLIAAIAPALWLAAPVAGIALLGAVALDGLRAGRLRDMQAHAPDEGEVGQPVELTVLAEFDRPPAGAPEAALGFSALLGSDGRAALELAETEAGGGVWSATTAPIPPRRGIATLDTLWLRWPGPLGLAVRQTRRELGGTIRIRPDISPVRSPALQAFLRDSQFGLVSRRMRGEGTQFEALREYAPGMDRRRIDWKASARHTKLQARENEVERDNQILFAFDCGQAMCEPVAGLPRIDRAVTAALTAAYVALKGGDRVALYAFAERPRLMTPFATDSRGFHRLRSAAAEIDYTAREANFTLALATLAARLKRRSLIVLFSDFADTTSAELMIESIERLVRYHLVIFVTMEDAELAELADAAPDTLPAIASAVLAGTMARQRALVLQRLRRLGVDVIEAPWDAITYRLIDRYLLAKQREAIG